MAKFVGRRLLHLLPVLFAVTLLKVTAFDLSQVRFGYRILSFLGLGLLLLATSVLYGRLGPRLLRPEQEAAPRLDGGGGEEHVRLQP